MPPGSVNANGGAGTVTVTTEAECAWSAAVGVPWITGLTPASGQGAGQVEFQVAPNPAPTPRQGMITVSDQHAQVTQAGAACHFDLSPLTQAVAATGGTGSVAVSTLSGCAWTATSGAAWVTITSGTSATASGVVQFSVAANSGAARAGSIAIGDEIFEVTQAAGTQPGVPCVFTLDTTSQSVGAGGGTATTTVRTDPTCSWTAASNVSWLTVSGSGAGMGNQLVSLTVAANAGSSRVGTATIAGQTFTVTEAGSCAMSVTPSSQAVGAGGGSGSETVVTAAGCAWTASTGDTWLTITTGASGNGNGTVNFTATANSGPSRTGTLTIAGQGISVMQAAGCAASINPTSEAVGAGGGAGSPVTVTVAAGCGWTATTTDSWITVTSGASGTGNGTVNFTAAANAGSSRSGTITIAGQPLTVTQGTCSFAINPTSQSIGAAGGAGTPSSVTTTAGCAWTAAANDPWLRVTSGATGTGNGSVNFTIDANTGPARAGTLTIATNTFTVNQASGCSFAINPTSQSFPRTAGTSNPVTVTTAAGCAWTATTTDTWITITTGGSGAGNGSVTFTISANPGPARTGHVTIAGLTFTVTQAGS